MQNPQTEGGGGSERTTDEKESKSIKSPSFTLQHARNDQVDVKGHNPRCNHGNQSPPTSRSFLSSTSRDWGMFYLQ